jgi:molecular chaperone GrpE
MMKEDQEKAPKNPPELEENPEQQTADQELESPREGYQPEEDENGQESLQDESGEADQEEQAELQLSLDETREKAQEYLEGWQRSRAEFANYKKRIMKEKQSIHQYARGEVIKDFLDIADDLGRALQDRPESGEGAAWADGIELIYKKLLSKLEAEGVQRMEAEGEAFDPNIHEAIFMEDHEDYESGQIIEVVQDGYYLGDRVLRPALVRVAA